MNRGILTTVVLAALLVAEASLPAAGAETPRPPAVLHGKVTSIADGDTITVLLGRTQHRIRLHGIDAPEKGQAFSNKSRQALADMVFGKFVRVRVVDKDRYGRLVGCVCGRYGSQPRPRRCWLGLVVPQVRT